MRVLNVLEMLSSLVIIGSAIYMLYADAIIMNKEQEAGVVLQKVERLARLLEIERRRVCSENTDDAEYMKCKNVKEY